MTRLMQHSLLALALVFTVTALSFAHEQKFMGSVASIEGVHLTITTTEGKSITVMLHEKTKIFRGKETKQAEDIKTGDRIVVITTDGKNEQGKAMLMAKEIRLGTAGAAK